ncbi:MAG: zf-HC2 domain-containing protein [Candidatus Eisenbacteria bacterium]
MNAPSDSETGGHAAGPACLGEEVIEEYAVGSLGCQGLAVLASAEVGSHLETCVECRRQLEAAKEEVVFLREALGTKTPPTPGNCRTDEVLALYLDDSLEAERRAETEHHLARCGRCTRRLIALFDEVQAVSAPRTEEELPTPASFDEVRADHAARQAANAQVSEPDKSLASESIPDVDGDAEERKKRYSSQSS